MFKPKISLKNRVKKAQALGTQLRKEPCTSIPDVTAGRNVNEEV